MSSQATTDRSPGWRLRDREWAWFAAAASLTSLITAAWPQLDLAVSALAYSAQGGFVASQQTAVRLVYLAVPWLGRGMALLALLAWLIQCGWGLRWPTLRTYRRLLMLGLAMLMGVGAVVNGALKENWGRARPLAVHDFGGSQAFVPALRPSHGCRSNCSFVSGHAATGFVLIAAGTLGSARTRRLWLGVGMAAGLSVGAVRIVQGAHFLSDVLFAGVVVWGCVLAIRALWWRRAINRRARYRGADTTG